jgi:hypothetical protein
MSDLKTVPEPREDDGGGFAETGGDVDELRFAFRNTISPRLGSTLGLVMFPLLIRHCAKAKASTIAAKGRLKTRAP